MTVVAVIFTPLVLLYQGWTYWVFRRRIARAPHPRRRVRDGREPEAHDTVDRRLPQLAPRAAAAGRRAGRRRPSAAC